MPYREFAALGFDPAPGDPARLLAAAESAAAAARTFDAGADGAADLRLSAWSGPGGDAYRAGLAGIPRDLDTAHRAHRETASALRDLAGVLDGLQRRAGYLESEAAVIAGRPVPTRAADLAAVRGLARGVRVDHGDAVTRTIERIRAAAALAPYRDPGWWSRTWQQVRDWVGANDGPLRLATTVLSAVSTAAALLAWVPVVGQVLGVVGLVAGGALLLTDVLRKLTTGEGSWGQLALDTVLTVVPAGKLAGLIGRGARSLRGVVGGRGLATAERVMARLSGSTGGGIPRVVPGATYFADAGEVARYYGFLLRSDGSALAHAQVDALRLVPKELHSVVRDHMLDGPLDAGLYFGDKKLVDLGLSGLDNVALPRDIPPGTPIDDVAMGVHLPDRRALAVGERAGAGPFTTLHEFAHMFDVATGGRSGWAQFDMVWADMANAVYPARPDAHYLDWETGPSETFAEGFAQYFGGGSRMFGSTKAMTVFEKYMTDVVLRGIAMP